MNSRHTEGPSLRQIQEWMAARILGPASGELTDLSATVDQWLCVPEPEQVGARMRIYGDAYPARVHDSLAETYPTVASLVGEQVFNALAGRYAASIPLTSYNLNDAGAEMPAFLRHDALTNDLPFLSDLATLEWRVALAFHAVECPPLDPRTLSWAVDDWANAILYFQRSVAVVSSAWPVLDLWAARDTPRTAIDIELHERPNDLVVRRAGLIVRCESVSASEALALRLLLEGHCLAETAGRLELVGSDPSAVLEWFRRWMSAGMIANAVIGDAPEDK